MDRREVTSSEEMKALTERLARRTQQRAAAKPRAESHEAQDGDVTEHRADASLPVRTPGASYRGDDDGGASSVTAEGAIGIRSALSAYDEGRKSASAHAEQESDAKDVDEGESR